MTLVSMQQHEDVTLSYGKDDYRYQSLGWLAQKYVTGKEVLDMRCLTGHLAVRLAQTGCNVTALDGYFQAVDMTNTRARDNGINKDIAQLWELTGLTQQVKEDQFDTVICLDVLNHVGDDKITMADITKVLKPGGRLILSIPAFPALLGQRDKSLGHLRRYTKSDVKQLLSDNGLAVIKIRYWNFIALPFYILIEKVFKTRLSDKVRYGRSSILGSLPNKLLGFWYKHIENTISFPCGLSFIVIAQKQ